VALLGGSLAFYSERGVGSRFYFTIPLAAPGDNSRIRDTSDVLEHFPILELTDRSPVGVPESLAIRLIVAAELHSATALKAAIEDLRQLGPDQHQLAEQLRILTRSFDMSGVQRLLTQRITVSVGDPAASEAHVEPICTA